MRHVGRLGSDSEIQQRVCGVAGVCGVWTERQLKTVASSGVKKQGFSNVILALATAHSSLCYI